MGLRGDLVAPELVRFTIMDKFRSMSHGGA
jgi:hypothetical protein